jgi:malate dehydrogenase (quinone)
MQQPRKITLIGAGIMSATLGIILKKIMPNVLIDIYERLDKIGAESSAAWNNAGTGHSAFCELNYTPLKENDEVDISKALRISQSFETSKQFWAYLKQEKDFYSEFAFINDIDHMSFVWGNENVAFLKKRYQALTKYAMFEDMKYSENYNEISKWIPLMMKDRPKSEKIAVTRMPIGTDVNFGAITRSMINYLKTLDGVEVHLGQEIKDIKKQTNNTWKIEIEDLESDKKYVVTTDFVFIGAGGGSLKLLEKSNIAEGRGYGGFPISGQWLRCTNKEVIKQHEAKVYGKAEYGSPPMSVPHLDTRMMHGERALLFGPYAGFSTKFLKNGSYFDLPLSLEIDNIWPMISAGIKNFHLTKYLVKQVMQSPEERFEMLQKYYPNAKFEDWELAIAGQRVQIIKKDEKDGGVLKFGTEIVIDKNKTLSALLGASPGASTAVSIMLELVEKCFPELVKTEDCKNNIKKMIPTYGKSLIENDDLCRETRMRTTEILKLEEF